MSVLMLFPIEVPVAVEDEIALNVKEFNLLRNYPNPFNASTTIEYKLMKNGKFEILVFDINGRKVSTLQSGFKSKGIYQFVWNASDMSSGIYYLKLIASDNTETKKILLLK